MPRRVALGFLLTLTVGVTTSFSALAAGRSPLHLEAGIVEAFATATATVAPPDPPTNLTGVVIGSTVNLSWIAPTGGAVPTGYLIEAALTPGGPAIASLALAPSSISVPNVPIGTYFVRVRAVNVEGVSPSSNEIMVSVGAAACITPPNPPTGLTSTVNGSVVALAWTPSASGCPATGFIVRAGSAPNLTNLVNLPVGNVIGLQAQAPPGTYFVTIAAQNAFGTSAASNEVAVTVGPSCMLPGAPTAFAVGSTGSTASMSWALPTSGGTPESYILEAGSGPGLANLAVLPLLGLSFATTAPPGTYFLRVKAQNACGVGPASAEQVLTTPCLALVQPGVPTASVSQSTANLSWSPIAGATSYQLAVGTTAGASNILNTVVPGTMRQLTGLAGGTYFMRVSALNACGASPVSGEGTFAILCLAPAQPGLPSASVSGSTANLAWSPVAGATSYQLAVGTTAGASDIINTTIDGTTRQLTGLASGTYFMRVSAVSECGTGAVSAEGTFAIALPTPVVSFTFDSEVTPADRIAIQEGITLAQNFFAQHGLGVPISTNVRAYGNFDLLVSDYAAIIGTSVSVAQEHWVGSTAIALVEGFIFVNAASWQNAPPYAKAKVMVHEFYHVLQSSLAGGTVVGGPSSRPRWLAEGSAEHVAWRAVGDAGLFPYQLAKSESQAQARLTAVPLASMENLPGIQSAGQSAYPLMFVAVDFLVGLVPEGIHSLREYWEGLQGGSAWAAAFDAAFGRVVPAFYDEFAVHRQALFPPITGGIRGRVTRANGSPYPGIHVYACPTAPGSCSYVQTGVDGAYQVTISGAYRVQFGRTSDGAHPDGYYSASGFTADSAQASIIVVGDVVVSGIDVQLPF